MISVEPTTESSSARVAGLCTVQCQPNPLFSRKRLAYICDISSGYDTPTMIYIDSVGSLKIDRRLCNFRVRSYGGCTLRRSTIRKGKSSQSGERVH